MCDALASREAMKFAPNGGRPCDGAFPYYRIMLEDCGLSMAIDWTGQWAASFKGFADGVHVRAGQEKTNLRLMPGESIRTPRVPLLSWSGDVSRGVNLWRRWYLAHILPRPNGQSMKPHLACGCPGEGVEFTGATEEIQLLYIEKAKQHGIPFDVWWIDADWYPRYDGNGERQWPLTGTWEPDPERFPNGLKPVSDCATRISAALLLWFEPERVHPGTKLDIEHPEWLLRSGNAPAAEAERVRVPFCRLFGSDSRRKGPFLTSHHFTRRSTQRSPIDHLNGYRRERMEGK